MSAPAPWSTPCVRTPTYLACALTALTVLVTAACAGTKPPISTPSARERAGLDACSGQHPWVQHTPRTTLETVFGVGSASELGAAEARARAAAAAAISVDVREEMSDKETVWIVQGERATDHTQTEIQRAVDSFVVRRLNACETRSKCGGEQDVRVLVACERRSALEKRFAEAAHVVARTKLPPGSALLSVPGIDQQGYVTQLGEYAARVLRSGVTRALAQSSSEVRVASAPPWQPTALHEAARAAGATHLLRVEHVSMGGTRVHVSCYVQDTRDDHHVPGSDVAFDVELEPSQVGLLALRGPLLPQKDAQDLVNTHGSFRLPIRLSKNELQEGESVQLTVQIPTEAYVYIYDVYEDGRVVLLHPSSHDDNPHFAAGSELRLPSASWKRAGLSLLACPLRRQPVTREYVKVIASPSPLELPGTRAERGHFVTLEGGPASDLAALRERLESLTRSGVALGTAEMPYFIYAKRAPELACRG